MVRLYRGVTRGTRERFGAGGEPKWSKRSIDCSPRFVAISLREMGGIPNRCELLWHGGCENWMARWIELRGEHKPRLAERDDYARVARGCRAARCLWCNARLKSRIEAEPRSQRVTGQSPGTRADVHPASSGYTTISTRRFCVFPCFDFSPVSGRLGP